ncbi:cytochrome c family protein [Candidatus Endowatersipora endosymbiont of Watersipora subatra]|uniref:c-type cytochrome n=1 Tax=Candidatus Endowatersipora endosymbiont of Watersipora subatra TaxID=3077946 RepID=UPI00312C778A
MDSFEWNKIFGALLSMAFLVLGLNFFSENLYHIDQPDRVGFIIATDNPSHGHEKKQKKLAIEVETVSPLIASADLGTGQKVMKKCLACHNFEKGAKNKVGPALYGVLGRPIGSVDDFRYSNAMKDYARGKMWTYDELNKFLFKPKAIVKGTSMGFAGLKKTSERAALIAYIRSLSDNPTPLPAK